MKRVQLWLLSMKIVCQKKVELKSQTLLRVNLTTSHMETEYQKGWFSRQLFMILMVMRLNIIFSISVTLQTILITDTCLLVVMKIRIVNK